MASTLIGRRAELSWLRARVDLALGGFAHLVIVEGESGIGKTRLAQEALDHARRRRAAVLRGRCYDHLDLPYLPLRDSLFAAVAESLAPRPHPPDQLALLRHVRAPTRPPARHPPSVLFVDDVDWADAEPLDLLRHLMFRLDDTQVPLLVLATSRADPTSRAAEGVARLRSEPRTAVVHLHALSALEATELARER